MVELRERKSLGLGDITELLDNLVTACSGLLLLSIIHFGDPSLLGEGRFLFIVYNLLLDISLLSILLLMET